MLRAQAGIPVEEPEFIPETIDELEMYEAAGGFKPAYAMALEKLIEVVKTEGKYPLRVLVLGEHEDLTYTDRVYTTSKGYTLKAAVLIPEESHFILQLS